jgi:hypothetical protein
VNALAAVAALILVFQFSELVIVRAVHEPPTFRVIDTKSTNASRDVLAITVIDGHQETKLTAPSVNILDLGRIHNMTAYDIQGYLHARRDSFFTRVWNGIECWLLLGASTEEKVNSDLENSGIAFSDVCNINSRPDGMPIGIVSVRNPSEPQPGTVRRLKFEDRSISSAFHLVRSTFRLISRASGLAKGMENQKDTPARYDRLQEGYPDHRLSPPSSIFRGLCAIVSVLLALGGLLISALGFKCGGDALGIAFEQGGWAWARVGGWFLVGWSSAALGAAGAMILGITGGYLP